MFKKDRTENNIRAIKTLLRGNSETDTEISKEIEKRMKGIELAKKEIDTWKKEIDELRSKVRVHRVSTFEERLFVDTLAIKFFDLHDKVIDFEDYYDGKMRDRLYLEGISVVKDAFRIPYTHVYVIELSFMANHGFVQLLSSKGYHVLKLRGKLALIREESEYDIRQ